MPSLFLSVTHGLSAVRLGRHTLPPSFGLCVGWCDLAMCVAVKRWHSCHFTFLAVSFCAVQLELSLVLVLVHQDFFSVSVMV
jgi:hypothetical protein